MKLKVLKNHIKGNYIKKRTHFKNNIADVMTRKRFREKICEQNQNNVLH